MLIYLRRCSIEGGGQARICAIQCACSSRIEPAPFGLLSSCSTHAHEFGHLTSFFYSYATVYNHPCALKARISYRRCAGGCGKGGDEDRLCKRPWGRSEEEACNRWTLLSVCSTSTRRRFVVEPQHIRTLLCFFPWKISRDLQCVRSQPRGRSSASGARRGRSPGRGISDAVR